mmetsp:Transcript_58481/g.165184  ORF Transcript_58481/g.165184 Transcript_58481/m.165184 type:complete len:216 (-) Transcript_58481:19-666(-)
MVEAEHAGRPRGRVVLPDGGDPRRLRRREHDEDRLELAGRGGDQGDLLLRLRHAVRPRCQGLDSRSLEGQRADGQGQGSAPHRAEERGLPALLLVLSRRQAHLPAAIAAQGLASGEAAAPEAQPAEFCVPAVLQPDAICRALGHRQVHQPPAVQVLEAAAAKTPPRTEAYLRGPVALRAGEEARGVSGGLRGGVASPARSGVRRACCELDKTSAC